MTEQQTQSLVSSPTNILTIQDVVLDSPVWRANVLHLEDQIDQFEKWIDGFIRALKNYIDSVIKHNNTATTLCKRTYFNGLDGTLIDNKMAGNVVTKFATTLQSTIAYRMKMASDMEDLLLNPLQKMIKNDLKHFKESRKQFEKTLDKYEAQLNRYNVLSKQKEASALREDAFQMYELRKLYVKNSSDHFARLVSFKANLEILLIECFSGALGAHIEEIDESAYTCSVARSKLAGWRQWLDESKTTSVYQVNRIKKRCHQLENLYIAQVKPHRSLKSYSTASNDQMLAVSSNAPESEEEPTNVASSDLNPDAIGVRKKKKSIIGKQGYLNSRIVSGKSRPQWSRRWFFLQDGWFGTCTVSTINREKGCIVLGDRIRISGAVFRVCTDMDRRYCFEVAHPKFTYYLQAETEQEMQQWLWAIENSMHDQEKRKSSTSPQLLLSPDAIVTDRSRAASSSSSSTTTNESPGLVAMSTSPLPSPDGTDSKSLTPILSTTTSKLTSLMIREATIPSSSSSTQAIDINSKSRQNSLSSSSGGSSGPHQFSSWNMPWLTTGINAFSNSDEDLQLSLTEHSQQDSSQMVVWPTKLEMDVPKPKLSHYSVQLEASQRELRKFFLNVPEDEIVVEAFMASLYRQPSDSHRTRSNSNDEDDDAPSYGYSGVAYITQRNLWFYSCTLMTCINMIVIPLNKIKSIRVENTPHSGGMIMIIETDTSPICFGLWLENTEVIIEKLKHAADNARTQNENVQQLYDSLRTITPATTTKNNNNKNKTPTSHVTTTSALYASVTPLTVQAQPIMIHPNISSSTTGEEGGNDNGDDDDDTHTIQPSAVEDDSVPGTPVMQATPPSIHRGSPAQGALAAVAAKNKKSLSVLRQSASHTQFTAGSATTTAADEKSNSNDKEEAWPSHIPKPSGPIKCDCTEHLEKKESDIVLPVGAKAVFDLMFMGKDVWCQLNASKNYGVPTVSEWKDSKRTLEYVMPVSNPMVKAKETDVFETQEIVQQKEYLSYVVVVTTKTPDLPYADAFLPTIKYCITYESPQSCRLVCSLGVKWLRSIFVKGMVNRAAFKGMQETVSGLIPIVKHEVSKDAVHLKLNNDKHHQQHHQQQEQQQKQKESQELSPQSSRLKALPQVKDKHSSLLGVATFAIGCLCLLFTMYQLWMAKQYQHVLNHSTHFDIVWRGVYLKDMEKELDRSPVLQQVNETIYDRFQASRSGVTQYNYQWSSKQHRLMAAELGYSRERLGAIRYELLSTFRILNRVEYQLLENEYWNWVSDRQLVCKDDCEALLKEMA